MKIDPMIFDTLVAEVQAYAGYLKTMGCKGVALSDEALKIVASWNPSEQPASSAPDLVEADETLEGIHAAISKCRRCRLADERKCAVFGAGPDDAKLMIVGGFPEPSDEQSGLPFSGEAGTLLTKIIEAMGFDREAVYICHAVKCRPKEDRAPNRFEAKACRTYLDRQIRVIQPEIICVFGELAAQLLLRTDVPIAKLRGRFHDYDGIRVMPTHDPDYLIANPSAKRATWEDMKMVMGEVQGSGL